MKRDIKLIKKILTIVQESDDIWVEIPNIEGYTEKEIHQHFILCQNAGFIDGKLVDWHTKRQAALTWKGYNYLSDRKRDEKEMNEEELCHPK